MIRLARRQIRLSKPVNILTRCLVNSARVFQSRIPANNSASLGIDKTIESNIQSETNKLAKTGARFWKKGDVYFNPDTKKYEIQLDGKTLRTPLGFPLELPESKNNWPI